MQKIKKRDNHMQDVDINAISFALEQCKANEASIKKPLNFDNWQKQMDESIKFYKKYQQIL